MGYLAKKNKRINRGFTQADFYQNPNEEAWDERAWESKHNIIYDKQKMEELMAWGQPSIYTDVRFDTEYEMHLFWKSRKDKSLEACIRRLNKTRGLMKGDKILIKNAYMSRTSKNKPVSLDYIYRVKEDRPLDIKWEINGPYINNLFKSDEWANKLTLDLRKAGFIVNVYNSNPNRLIGEELGQIAIAWGWGKRVGFSSGSNNFMGYKDGEKNVLFDKWDCFDKWSRCETISKSESIESIVEKLMTVEDEDIPDFIGNTLNTVYDKINF